MRSARWVAEELFDHPDRRLPQALLEQTRCVAVFPDVPRAAFGLGGSHGSGVVSCRDEEGDWSAPVFMTVSGGSIGLQVGYQTSDLLLFFVNDQAARRLLDSQTSLGADLRVAAGSFDKATGVTSNKKLSADVYIYVRSRGLFVGASLEGSKLRISPKGNRKYYGYHLWPEGILFHKTVPEYPPESREFITALEAIPMDYDVEDSATPEE
ncbi:MAG: lipid-binding SYLF domain-containing protein [Thermoanaerobaculia bacterium]